MVRAFLLLGSNLGNRKNILRKGLKSIIDRIGPAFKSSSVYQTAPWGKTDQGAFLNQVVELATTLTPAQLLKIIQSIEEEAGRTRSEQWGPRTLDIDILFYGNQIIRESDLIIPHPGIESRKFTLVPMNEIAPNLKHPVSGKTVKELLEECRDDSEILNVEF